MALLDTALHHIVAHLWQQQYYNAQRQSFLIFTIMKQIKFFACPYLKKKLDGYQNESLVHINTQNYSKLRQLLWKFRSLHKAETEYAGSLKVISCCK